ncbi:MAG: hypothetical protein M1826_003551 [Phylliscum demangeonii]|nr:MAG: hypothetical protein M1826_002986 [Phylliscum demangeonii]KAI9831378.1 MAG: hypothetical protein M1826_003551 [Phylliscum demangeonii]
MALSPEGDSAAPPANMLVLGTEGQALDRGSGGDDDDDERRPTLVVERVHAVRLFAEQHVLVDGDDDDHCPRCHHRCRCRCRPHPHTHAHAHAYAGADNGGSSGCICACRHEHSNLNRLKMLILREVVNIGFQSTSDQTLYTWGKTLMPTSFGAAPGT